MMPNFSLEGFRKVYAYKDPAHLERILVNLRKAGLPETPPLPLPDKPSIAVLPFVNMSGDPEQEYFSDGITEEIITALSKTPKMFVIARTSSFKYKGKEVDVRTVGRELGVRHVLEGSVRRAGDKVRITSQLVDAKTGNHLWAERCDRDLKDIFAVQDEITIKIITAMQVKLTKGEQAHLWARGTKNLDAHQRFMQGDEHFRRFNADGFMLARQFFEEAVALDPEYPDPYIRMGDIHMHEARLGISENPQKSIGQALELAQKALALDESHPWVHNLLGFIYLGKRQYEKGIAACERAVALSPNNVDSLSWLGLALSATGRPQEAIPYLEKAIRLNPVWPMPAAFYLGDTYRVMDKCEDAIPWLKKALRYQQGYMILLNLAACYSALGREEEAKSTVTQLLESNPRFSLERFAEQMVHRGAVKESFLDNLRKAGLK
jgi:TolB-like protein/Tfp pilus assembly protein PilF